MRKVLWMALIWLLFMEAVMLITAFPTFRYSQTRGTVQELRVALLPPLYRDGVSLRGSGGGSTSWQIVISYSYEVNGQRYVGNRIWWNDNRTLTESIGRFLVNEIRQKSINGLPVFYDQDDPKHSVVYRGIGADGTIVLIASFVLLMTVVLLPKKNSR